MKKVLLALLLSLAVICLEAQSERIYHSGGMEFILSGADMNYTGTDVNTNMRFTLFFHTQQFVNFDLNDHVGLFTGLAIRNVGLIMEDYYQYVTAGTEVDQGHPDYNKNTKIKHRSYSLGFPLAFKIGSFDKNYFFYAGGEYEWMFAYKQKKFIDGEKYKFTNGTSERMNPWIPSLFAGVQLPGGVNLKFKYYLKDFLNQDFTGTDFGEAVDYSQFESSNMWYISLAFIFNRKQLNKLIEDSEDFRTAYR
jgi:hypothetical protein